MKWNREKEKRWKETVISYTSSCGKYCISKLYAPNWQDDWYIDKKDGNNWKHVKGFKKFKDAKQFANELIKLK